MKEVCVVLLVEDVYVPLSRVDVVKVFAENALIARRKLMVVELTTTIEGNFGSR